MKNNVAFLSRSFYHVFISIIKSINNESTNTIYCIEDQMDKGSLVKLKNKVSSLFDNIEIKIISSSKVSFKKELQQDFQTIYFFHWTVYKRPEYNFFMKYKKSKIILIEDGATHFAVYDMDFKTKKIYLKFLVNFLLLGSRDLTLSRHVDEIYATFPQKFPVYFNNRIKELDINKKLSEDDRKKILSLFEINFPTKTVDKSNIAVVFTQPLSEDNFIDENEKTKAYKCIVDILVSKGYQVILKQHPRELTDYIGLSDNIIELNRYFPAEILNYLNLDIKISTSICSGVIYNINSNKHIQVEPNFFTLKNKQITVRSEIYE